MAHKRLALLAGFIGAAAACAVAAAQPPRPARVACVSSVFRLCPGAAMAGDRHAAKDCLLKKLPRATSECQAAVKSETAADAARDLAPTDQ